VLYQSCGSNNSLVPYIQELDQKLLPSILDLFRADIHDVREFQSRMYAMFQKYFDENLNAFGPDGSYIRIWLECRCIIIYSYFQVASRLHGLKEKGLRIYGEGQWNQILPEYGYPTRRLNYPEMYAAFQNSKIIFCFTKKLFVGNVHERVFHILGAGGFPLSDHRDDIDVMFDPGEVVTYRSFDEAKSLIDFYTKNETARKNVIEKGRAKVFSKHSYAQRMSELVQIVAKHYGLNAAPHRTTFSIQNSNWMEDIVHPPKLITPVV
jgi:hypothetical protein